MKLRRLKPFLMALPPDPHILCCTRASIDYCRCSGAGVCAYNVSQKQQGQCSTVFLGFVTFSRSSNWPSFKSNWLRRTGAVPKSRRGSWRKANFRTSKHGSTRALWPQGSVWFGGRSGENQLGLKFTAIFYNVYIYKIYIRYIIQ